jgi:hypothetical protein
MHACNTRIAYIVEIIKFFSFSWVAEGRIGDDAWFSKFNAVAL